MFNRIYGISPPKVDYKKALDLIVDIAQNKPICISYTDKENLINYLKEMSE